MNRIAVLLCTGSMLLGVLALPACTTVGPDYHEPDVAWLSSWQSDLYGQISDTEQQSQTDLRFWWYLFDDSVLNSLIETAKRENPTLQIAGLRILESRAALALAASNRYPQVQQLNGVASYADIRQRGGASPDTSDSFTSYETDFKVAWELDFWGRFTRGIESADADFFASINNQHDVQVLLSAQVADLYFADEVTLLRMRIARENAAIQKRSLEITQRLFDSGQSSELDLQQAKTQYLATLSTIPQLEIALTQIRNALCALLGRAPGNLPELAAAKEELPRVDPVAISAIPARLLMRRPDVRVAAWQAAAQSAQIGIAEADFYPAISLFGTVGWSGTDQTGSPETTSVVLGPGFSWNVFDFGRIRNNVRVQDAQLQQSIQAFQNTVLQAAREIDDAAITVVKTSEQQGVLDESLQAARRSLELANTRYAEGYASFQRVLDAQRTLFSQAERAIVNRGDHISAVVELYRAIGGGWLDTPIQTLIPETLRTTMQQRSDWGDLLTAPLPKESTNPAAENSP